MNKLFDVNIARVSTVPFFIVTQLNQQISVIAEEGANVYVITSDGPGYQQLANLQFLTLLKVPIERSITLFRDLNALFQLIWLLRKYKIVIVHSTTPKAGLLTALASWLARTPIRLHTFTGQPWVQFTGISRWFLKKLDSVIGYLNTSLYADSESQLEFLVNEGVISRRKIRILGSGSLAGVDLDRFDSSRFGKNDGHMLRDSLGIPTSSPVVLFVGRVNRDKGINVLLDAFSNVSNTRPDTHLVIVGPLDEDSGVHSNLSWDSFSKMTNVHHVGFSSSPEKFMAISDILCLPSYREGFGTVVLEAAAMGLPTIGSNIYGLSDAIVDGVTGLLVPVSDVESLQNAILHLLADVDLRSTMGAEARRRVRDKFDSNYVNHLVIDEYYRLLHLQGVR